VLRQELATVWLFFTDGPEAGVVARRYCRACAPSGPVTDVACVVCGDGPLLAGELGSAGAWGTVSAWLGEQGWRRGSGEIGDSDELLLCPRCAPVLTVPAWPTTTTTTATPEPASVAELASEPAAQTEVGADDEGEWTLW
jgi:hypothetical protein